MEVQGQYLMQTNRGRKILQVQIILKGCMWNLKDHEYFHFLTTERGCMQFKFQKKKKKKPRNGTCNDNVFGKQN